MSTLTVAAVDTLNKANDFIQRADHTLDKVSKKTDTAIKWLKIVLIILTVFVLALAIITFYNYKYRLT